jgi:hypothetical protein
MAGRMQDESHGVDGRTQKLGRAAFVKLRQRRIRQHHIPVPVDREGRVRLVSIEDAVDGALRRLQFAERPLREGRREAGGEKQHVLIAKRDIQVLAQARDHLTAGLRPAGLETGQMPGRAAGRVGEIGLRHAAALAATPEQDAERKRVGCHNVKSSPRSDAAQ